MKRSKCSTRNSEQGLTNRILGDFVGNSVPQAGCLQAEIPAKKAKIRFARRVLHKLPTIGGVFLAKGTTLYCEKLLDIEQFLQNQTLLRVSGWTLKSQFDK